MRYIQHPPWTGWPVLMVLILCMVLGPANNNRWCVVNCLHSVQFVCPVSSPRERPGRLLCTTQKLNPPDPPRKGIGVRRGRDQIRLAFLSPTWGTRASHVRVVHVDQTTTLITVRVRPAPSWNDVVSCICWFSFLSNSNTLMGANCWPFFFIWKDQDAVGARGNRFPFEKCWWPIQSVPVSARGKAEN